MKTIIVPLDGSVIAEQVLVYVHQLASLFNARIHLLAVVTEEQKLRLVAKYAATPVSSSNSDETDWHLERRARAELVHATEEYLTKQMQAFHLSGLDVTFQVSGGAPAECIVEGAMSEPEALIAMATHGYSGLRRWTLGSVADQVIHTATVPIFLVRTVEHAPISVRPWKHILVPLDGSTFAEQALPLGIELANRARAELLLLHAVDPHSGLAPDLSPFSQPTTLGASPDPRSEQAHEELAATISQYHTSGVTLIPVVVFGDPTEAIVDVALSRQADLVVMATHGYSGIRRWALGSVADKVLHACTTPLLLVRSGLGERVQTG